MPDDRVNIFDDDEPIKPPLNLEGFTPKKAPKAAAPTHVVRDEAEKRGFVSREPASKPVKKADRRYRTGRSVHLAAKWSQAGEDALNAIYERHINPTGKPEWTLGQILEMSVLMFDKADRESKP